MKPYQKTKYLMMVLFLLSLLVVFVSCSPSHQSDINFTETWEEIKGIKYTWGGSSPKVGFDCSGAIRYVFKSNGINIPLTTSRKLYYYFNGKDLNWKNANRYDLIWWTFSSDRPFGHIGMIDSNNTAWQAGSSTGIKNIKLIENGYWDNIFEACKSIDY